MNFELSELNQVNPILKEVAIQKNLLGVVKPENVNGTFMVLQKTSGETELYKYDELTKSELKHGGYIKAFFVTNESLKLKFRVTLFSDEQNKLMETTLTCQVKITDPKEVVKLNKHDVSGDVYSCLSDILSRNIVNYSSSDVLIDINDLFITIVNICKNMDLECLTIINCIQSDTVITDEAKRNRVKGKVLSSIHNKDLYDMADNKEKIEAMNEMATLLQSQQITALKLENEKYDLLSERYENLKDSGVISPDISMSEFMRQIEKLDPEFGSKPAKITDSGTEEAKEEAASAKSYFEE